MTGKRNTAAKKERKFHCTTKKCGACAGCRASVPESAAQALTGAADYSLMRLLGLCRQYGVLRFEGNIPGTELGVKFDLAPVLASDPPPVRASVPREPAAQPQAAVKDSTKKVGSDGLTAEQQDELYARPMDAKG